ncbi:Protein kinase-like domain [Pseudocohnilembus persalinus]|uniref:Protein kinase-like domain n=1 Tax=Pseudocohnilembus persalinus TaxID=266149 RepID=A0A0V0QUG0_PSEPJ|nr:Protein kinase-like domain [Pseudocohnilembus persalinus]|eukprot:KRX05873.1 Protein kinase-like domain [Pseudocohnilembus persalinus]
MIDITLKNAFTGDFDQKNMCVFACVQGPQDAVQITMYNAPRLNESQKGTIITIAPEVFEGFYDDKCDIYSLGCTLYWMIYKKFMYEECKNNAIMLNMEQKKNNIVFPSEPPISDNLKSAIKQMMEEIEDQLEFNKIEKNFEDDEEKEQKALAYVEQVELKIKKQQVNVQMIARLKFEKGKAQVMRIIAKSVKDLTISRKLIYGENRVLIQDLLDLIYFGLNKFELIALKRIVNGLQDIENGFQIFNLNKTEWEMFVNSEDNQEYDKIYRALEKELNVFQNIIFKKAKQEAKKFIDIEIENKESVFKENYKIQNYLDDNISEEYAKYNQFNEFETTKNRVDQALNTFFSHHV